MQRAHSLDDRPLARACAGDVLGVVEGGLHVWRGLPYAHPPTGPRRFRPCEPLDAWTGPFDAARFGPASAQVFDAADGAWDAFGEPGPARAWVGDEASLTLNIWAPPGAARAPVLVFIHGGANWLESARLPLYAGNAFASAGLVFVSFNYRLGVFGFLDLAPIGGPPEAHGHGLTDQAAALRWVVRNIDAFGGDPGNITLLGESAGSMDAGWLLAGGLLPPGVRRLVLMSGVASLLGLARDGSASAHSPGEGHARAADLLARMGFDRFDRLAAASTGAILAAHARAVRDVLFDEDTRFYPRVGDRCPVDPFAAAAAGAGAGLDIIVGFTAHEMGLWLAWDDALDRRGAGWAAAAMPFVPSAARAALPGFYRSVLPDADDGARGMHLLGDAMFAMPSLWLADLLAANGARVWVYRYDRPSDDRRGALHCADLAMLFGRHGDAAGDGLLGPARDWFDARARDRLHAAMLGAVASFARTGDPSTAALPWPRYGPDRAMMLWDDHARVACDPLRERRAWWTANVLPAALGGGA